MSDDPKKCSYCGGRGGNPLDFCPKCEGSGLQQDPIKKAARKKQVQDFINENRDVFGSLYNDSEIVAELLLRAFEQFDKRIREAVEASNSKPKIVQVLIAPNDALWQGRLIGLGSDGVTYQTGADKWEPMVSPELPEPQTKGE